MARKSLSWEQKLGLTLLAETITPCLEHTRPGLKTTTLGSARAQHARHAEQVAADKLIAQRLEEARHVGPVSQRAGVHRDHCTALAEPL